MRWMIAALFILTAGPAGELDDSAIQKRLSAAFILDGCKEKTSTLRYEQGLCWGQIEMIYLLGFADDLAPKVKFCPPDGVTIAQTKTVITKYIEDRPQRLHEPFVSLAIDAVRAAWPCSK